MSEKDGNIDAHSVPIKSIHSNVAQVFIEITEDKLKIILNEYKDTQIDSKSWVAPLGIFIALVTTLTTSTSNDFLLPKEYWGSVYVGGALIAFFFLIRSCIKAWQARKNQMSVEDILEQIKGNQ